MSEMTAGITAASAAMNGVVWNILGQTYTLKQVSEHSMAWHAAFPPGTFVPPHVHPTQDEFIHVLTGQYSIWLNGAESLANPGDVVRMPKGMAHGIFNRGTVLATSLFWVAPTRRLETLFGRIHGMQDPQEVMRLAGEHEVDFLPPPGG